MFPLEGAFAACLCGFWACTARCYLHAALYKKGGEEHLAAQLSLLCLEHVVDALACAVHERLHLRRIWGIFVEVWGHAGGLARE